NFDAVLKSRDKTDGESFLGVRMVNKMVGNLIRDARLKADLTQGDLAMKLGVSISTVNKYEKKGQQVTIGTLLKIARVLEIDLMVGFLT
ncbi:MAG: XRE family transcriptional regulator, partial [Sphingobacteriales bacterium]